MKLRYLGNRSSMLKHNGVYYGQVIRQFTYITGLKQRFNSDNFVPVPDDTAITFDFMNKPLVKPAPVVKTLEQELLDKLGNRRPNICAFAIEYGNGYRSIHDAAPCHAGLAYNNNVKGANTPRVKLFNALKNFARNDQERADLIRFMDYVCNRSPWKIAFDKPFTPDMIDTGVTFNVNEGMNVIAGACIAMRQATEFPTRLKSFIELVDLGFSENVSFFVACVCRLTDKHGNLPVIMGNDESGHGILHRRMHMGDLITFFNEGKFHEKGKAYSDTRTNSYVIFNSITRPLSNYHGFTEKDLKDTVFEFVRKNWINGDKQYNEYHYEGWGGKKQLAGVGFKRSTDNTLALIPIAATLSKVIK